MEAAHLIAELPHQEHAALVARGAPTPKSPLRLPQA